MNQRRDESCGPGRKQRDEEVGSSPEILLKDEIGDRCHGYFMITERHFGSFIVDKKNV